MTVGSNNTNNRRQERPFQRAKELVKERFGTDLTEEGYGLILSIARKEGR